VEVALFSPENMLGRVFFFFESERVFY